MDFRSYWLKHFARVTATAAVLLGGTVVFATVLSKHLPIDSWVVWRLAPLWAYAVLFVAASLAGGNAVLRLLLKGASLPPVEWVLQSMAVGVVVFVVGFFALGVLHLWSPVTAWGWPVLLMAWGVRPGLATWSRLVRYWRDLPPIPLGARLGYSAIAAWGVVGIGFVYLGALHPSAIHSDAAWYHLPIAQDYAREGGIVGFPGESHRALPHLASVVYTWALTLPGLDPVPLKWMLALHLDFVMVLFRIVGVVAAAQYLLGKDRTPALWVVFFLFPSVFIGEQRVGASADQFVAFFSVPVFLALARCVKQLGWRRLVLLGLVLGGHLMASYQGLYLAVAVAIVLGGRWLYLVGTRTLAAWRREDTLAPSWRVLLLAPAVLVLVVGLTTAPHTVKNAAFHGNPLYPYAASVFPSSHPTQPPEYYFRVLLGTAEHAPPVDGLERQVWAVKSFFTHSLQVAEDPLGKRLPYWGALFSLLVPCVPFVRRNRRLYLGTAVFFLAFWVWVNTGIHDGYLLAFYGIGMGVTGALLVRLWELGVVARMALVPLLGLQLFWGGDAMLTHSDQRLRATTMLIGATHKTKSDDKRFAMRAGNRALTATTNPDVRILARNYQDLLGLDRSVASDTRERQGNITYTRVQSPRQMWQQLRDRGITHLAYPEGQRRPHRWNNTVLFGAVAHHSRNERRFGRLILVPLSDTPPPGTDPYLVLTHGLKEYRSGLYRVEQLDVDDRTPKAFVPRPRPIAKVGRRNLTKLLQRAQAIASDGRRLPGEAGGIVARDFELVETFPGGFALHVRKVRTER